MLPLLSFLISLVLPCRGSIRGDRPRVDRRPTVHEHAAVPVGLVAKQLISKGTPGLIVATNGMYQATTILPPKEVEDGAVADPSYLSGRVAVVDILPGQQLTATDFTATP